ncbi:MAG: biopolymer transporter ExbD [Paracoccaceae bacterium]
MASDVPVRPAREGRRRRRAAIALTPLIDVVFILLVFFMLASRFLDERSLTLSAAGGGGGGMEGAMLLEVRAEGLRLSGEALTPEALAARLETRIAERPETRVILQAGEGVDVQRTVAAIDLAARAGVARLALAP